MPQLSLLDPGPSVLVDDRTGRIAYTPGVVPPETAAAWFAALRAAVPWKAQRRRMYDRDVDVPRLTANYRLLPPDPSLPPALAEAARRVIAAVEAPFSGVGLNLYRDGRDSVAPHNDHLDEIVEGFPIALLSLGATRRMAIREKEASRRPRRSFHLDLEAGSLLTMSWASQLHYDHGVPKTAEPVGERISLAFRVKPRCPENDGAEAGFYR